MLRAGPVLFLGGHFGNWEISVNTFGHFGFPMGVVARPLDNPYLHKWFKDFRESTGNSLILKHGAGSELSEIMEQGGMASLLCDQDAGANRRLRRLLRSSSFHVQNPSHCWRFSTTHLLLLEVPFVCPDAAQRDARWVRFNLATQDVIDPADYQGSNGIAELTQRFTSSLEDLIRKAPEQYFWVHRRWKSPPDIRKRNEKRRRHEFRERTVGTVSSATVRL